MTAMVLFHNGSGLDSPHQKPYVIPTTNCISEDPMIVSNEQHVSATSIVSPDVKNAALKVLVGTEEGWADHVMRIIELGPDGYSPRHKHKWPHINYMIEGSGTLSIDGREHAVESGGYAYVPANTEHQFRNTGDGTFRFICIVPTEGHQ
jgi:quercetin dioxygenase-like cupin family protein